MKVEEAAAQFIRSNKKKSEFSHWEWTALAERIQKLYAKAAQTQTFARIEVGDGTRPVCVFPFSDIHWGARGVDYKRFRQLTKQIIETPNLVVALVGDLVEFAIKLRSVAEVCAQIFGPDKQVQFLEDWLDEISPKIILATWCNHAVEREEKQAGVSLIKKMLASRTIMFDGIGHADIICGKQTYKFAFSHKFQGYSYLNATHAGQRYMRFQGIDREIAVMGDKHTPAYQEYHDGPQARISMVAGTLNTKSVYANRYFSIFTQSNYPCVELHADEHLVVPFQDLGAWQKYRKLRK